MELLSEDQMMLISCLMQSHSKRLKIDGVFTVSCESNMPLEATSDKFFNFGDEPDRGHYRPCKNISVSQREILVHRIALQEWDYV